MPNSKHTAYGTETTLLGTELNALANATNTAAGSAFNNASGGVDGGEHLFMDIKVNLGAAGSARSANAFIRIWILEAIDGTNYDDLIIEKAPAATFNFDATSTARQQTIRNIEIPPCNFKIFARNGTGQALHATANTIKGRAHSIKIA